MRVLVLFALTFSLWLTLADDATACGRRKMKKSSAAVMTYSVAPASGCCGSAGSYYGGSPYHPYHGSSNYGTSYYGGANYGGSYYGGYPNYSHSSHYYGTPYYGTPNSYPNNYGGPALMPRAMPGSAIPNFIPFLR